MPAPPLGYNEMEAAIAWGYTLRDWQEESVVNRAKAVAHVIHRNLREAYTSEVRMEKAGGKDGKKPQSFADYMRAIGAA